MNEDPTGGEGAEKNLGPLAHKMNNAVAYVVTNLNLLAEELEVARLPTDSRERLQNLADEASLGAERVGDLIRELRVLSWGDQPAPLLGDPVSTEDKVMKSLRLLVVDDEPFILASVQRALSKYEVLTAPDGETALEILKAGHVDLVLSDLIMGDTSGMALYRWIERERPELLSRVILMTAGAFTPDVRAFLSSIRNPVLHKPFDTKTLRWIIAQALKDL